MVKHVHSKRKLFAYSKDQKENTTPSSVGSKEESQFTEASQDRSQFAAESPSQSHQHKSGELRSDFTTTPKHASSSSDHVCKTTSPSLVSNHCLARHSMPKSERQQIALVLQLSSPPANKQMSRTDCGSPFYGEQPGSGVKSFSKRNERGETPLHVAAIRGDIERVQQLLSRGCDVNAVDYAGWTALHEACNRGFTNIAEQLIKAGAAVNAKGLDNDTPLHDACVNNHFKFLHTITRKQDKETLLMDGEVRQASVLGEIMLANAALFIPMLLRSPAQSASRVANLDSMTAIFAAIELIYNVASVKDIFCRPANFNGFKNVHNLAGRSAEIVRLLLSNGARVDVVNKRGKTPSDVCRSPGILSLLIQVKTSDTVGCDEDSMSRRTSPSSKPEAVKMDTKQSDGCPDAKPDEEDSNSSLSAVFTSSACGTATAASQNPSGSTGGSNGNASPGSPRVTLRLPSSNARTPDKSARTSSTDKTSDSVTEDPYEFKCKDESERQSTASSPCEEESNADKRPLEEEEDGTRRKKRRDDCKESSGQPKPTNRGSRVAGEKCSKGGVRAGGLHGASLGNKSSSTSPSPVSSGDRKSPLIPSSNSPKANIKQEKVEDISDEEGSRHESSSSGASTGGPKVPPLKIVLSSSSSTSTSSTQEQEPTGGANKTTSSRHVLYVVPANEPCKDETGTASVSGEPKEKGKDVAEIKDSNNHSGKSKDAGDNKDSITHYLKIKEEPLSPGGSSTPDKRAPRVTRSHRVGCEESTAKVEQKSVKVEVKQEDATLDVKVETKPDDEALINCPPTAVTSSVSSSSTCYTSSAVSSTCPATGSCSTNESVHPRKRRLNIKEEPEPCATVSYEPPLTNCFQMFRKIRKQIDDRRKLLFPVRPKPPQGFKDYLMNRGTYVLAGNKASYNSVPLIEPPAALCSALKELFTEQERDRWDLRLKHQIEREKLVLSVEQEILRVHGRAARELANQALPFSACTVLKDQEVYSILTPEQEEKHRSARSRYNGRLFLSWLQDVDDKWEKIKESMVLRQQNEAESLNAVHRMNWEWKLRELGLIDNTSRPVIEEIHVPTVAVSDFDLLPV